MFYFPVINGTYPQWFPWVGGQSFTFFRPVFNIADSAITIAVVILLIRQRKFFAFLNDPAKAKKEDVVAESAQEPPLDASENEADETSGDSSAEKTGEPSPDQASNSGESEGSKGA